MIEVVRCCRIAAIAEDAENAFMESVDVTLATLETHVWNVSVRFMIRACPLTLIAHYDSSMPERLPRSWCMQRAKGLDGTALSVSVGTSVTTTTVTAHNASAPLHSMGAIAGFRIVRMIAPARETATVTAIASADLTRRGTTRARIARHVRTRPEYSWFASE